MARISPVATATDRRTRLRRPAGGDAVPADLMAQAVDVMGSESEARSWFAAPAMGLGQRRPASLIGTAAGRAQICNLLDRMKHGVYV